VGEIEEAEDRSVLASAHDRLESRPPRVHEIRVEGSPASFRQPPTAGDLDQALIDQILGRLADLVVDRLMERTAANSSDLAGEWLDPRGAAAYLGIHRDTLRKLAAQRAIPAYQDGPRCKLCFCRDELDDWGRSARPMRTPAARLRTVS
jgi:excisionase family DNA binding protein